jgi:hypothetical protein
LGRCAIFSPATTVFRLKAGTGATRTEEVKPVARIILSRGNVTARTHLTYTSGCSTLVRRDAGYVCGATWITRLVDESAATGHTVKNRVNSLLRRALTGSAGSTGVQDTPKGAKKYRSCIYVAQRNRLTLKVPTTWFR